MAHFRDYYSWPIPAGLLEAGLSDESWHNDSCARMTKDLADGRVLVCWVENEDISCRENIGPRYVLCIEPDRQSYGEGGDRILLATEDLQEVLDRVSQEA